MYYLIIYFLAGILQDFLFTLNLRFLAKNKIFLTMLTSFLVTVVTMGVLYNILTKLDNERGILAIVIYALGIAVGTFLGMKFKPGF